MSLTESQGPSLAKQCLAEGIGTWILVFFGCGAVHSAVLTGAQSGLWQVAIVWGIAIMLACYVVGGVSGAHINPAMTLAFAVWGRFDWKKVGPYIASQIAGAMIAALCLNVVFAGMLVAKEKEKEVKRGEPGSIVTATCYGEYFPNPGPLAAGDRPYSSEDHEKLSKKVPHAVAFFAELLGTAVLALVVFAVTDDTHPGGPAARFAPVFIGLTVSSLISVLAPLTQACFNPARDFGPRLFAYFAGWGEAAIPGYNGIGFLTVYIFAPIVGAILGAGVFQYGLRGKN